LAAILVSALPAQATDPLEVLITTRSLKCTFPVGRVAEWDKGSPAVASSSLDNPLHFDSLDPRAGTGRFIGNAGSTDVRLFVTVAGLGIVETTPLGGFIVTTVFAHYVDRSTDFIAVHSRHIPGLGALSPPIPSQYHGTCKRWE
jgi:hypothetical protein